MALYWVGGTASWDATAGTKWSLLPGGSGGAAVPTAADDVRFDASSTGTCTITSTSVCRSLDTTGHTGTLSWGNSATAVLKVGDASGGALTIGTGTTIGSFTGAVDALQLVSSSSNGGVGWPITTNGKTLPPTTFGGTAAVTGGKWVLQDALAVTGSGSGLLRLTGGELDTNSKTVTLNWKFNASGSAVRVLTLGSSVITLAGTGTAWDITNGTNLTVTANSASVTVSAAGAGFVGGSKNYNGMSLAFSGSGTHAITGANTFASLTSAPGSTLTLPASATTAITGSFASGTAGNLVTVISSVAGTAATLSRASGTVSSDYLSLKDITATGGAAFYAGTHSTNVSGVTGWTFTDPPSNILVSGSQATETDTANPGAPSVQLPGTTASEAETPQAGTPAVLVAGARATETDTSSGGAPRVTILGSQGVEAESATAGAARVLVPGALAPETETPNHGTLLVTIPGSQAPETDTARPGTALVWPAGLLATEADTPNAGAPAVAEVITIAGQKATETDQAQPGSISITLPGHLAAELDTALAGTASVHVLGQLVQEIEQALAGTGGTLLRVALEYGQPETRWATGTPATRWATGTPGVRFAAGAPTDRSPL